MALTLPPNAEPQHYRIDIKVNLVDFTFEGSETIDIDILQDSNSITLNSTELEIEEAKIEDKPLEVIPDEDNQTVTFKTKFLAKGDVVSLTIQFRGKLNEHMKGFYRSSYEDDKGETQYLATTHFEPIACRSAFPCFDQPNLKATFEVALVVKENYTALSNMDIKVVESLENGYKKVQFHQTPLMSTYLVAFTVGELEFIESKKSRIPLKIWTLPGETDQATYALEIAETALQFYERVFKIDYPLSKLDLVSIPDFSVQAMENFGLITFKDDYLLAEEDHASTHDKNEIAETVFHEIAHQWFGNLVTMEFWDGLWLNEGFANWMSWYAINEFYPELKPWTSYIVYNLQNSLSLDSLRSSHPVEIPINTLNDIEQGFDNITYDKGAAVLVMIAKWIGEELFIEGVSKYLTKYSWKNTTTKNLWDVLSEISGKDINAVMDVWLSNVGFPLVIVDEDEESKEVTISQNRFLISGDCKPDEDKVLFPLSLNVRTSKGVDTIVLTERSKKFKIDTEDDFFKLNADQVGFYRTSYSEERWGKLGIAGRKGKLPVEDRIGLLADSAKLAASGYTSTTSFLNLVKQWSDETDFNVWSEMTNDFFEIQDAFIFADKELLEGLDLFLKKLISKQVPGSTVISEGDSYDVQQLKNLIFGTAYAVGEPSIIEYCNQEFKSFLENDIDLEPDQRIIIFKCIAKYGSQKEFDQLLELYEKSDNEDVSDDALASLGRFVDTSILQKFLTLVLELKEQDIEYALRSMRFHPDSISLLWKWLQDEWTTIEEKVGLASVTHLEIIGTCLSRLGTQQQKDEVEQFFKDKPEALQKRVSLSLEQISARLQWRTRDSSKITEWLKHNK
ncbi:alanine/arginine aminopeptidase [Scheffersomyces xylosifermentans]|uniref:alanine/arginine aminopeptidase n=1 Tax=Scheffersomyces xylosifermentans TaxID=1304137 RepID=UPI00315DBF8A